MVVLIDSHVQENFTLDTGQGNDTVRFEKTTVDGDVDLDLFAGQDLIEILLSSKLLGSSSFDGGTGIDTVRTQVGPEADAVEIAFMTFENLQLQPVVLS